MRPEKHTYGLPDPDDEHVVAAAVIAGAGAIVTSNLRDFPPDKVPSTIQVMPPAVFAVNTVALDPDAALRAVTAMTKRRTRPATSLTERLDLLDHRYAMTAAVEYLR